MLKYIINPAVLHIAVLKVIWIKPWVNTILLW